VSAHKHDSGSEPGLDALISESGFEFLADGGLIRCAFSTVKAIRVGVGSSSRKHVSQIYWYVEQIDDNMFEMRRINDKNVPAGDVTVISLNRLLDEYTPELAYYEEVVLPALESLEETVGQGDAFRKEGRLYSAELEYGRVLEIEESNVRAVFGLGLIHASRNEVQRTREILKQLVDIQAAFDGKNQHLFNEFGIALRKTRLFEEAVAYYSRALDFVTDDENLYYNLARAHYEADNWTECVEALALSYRLNPELVVTRDLLTVIVKLAESERLSKESGKPPVPSGIGNRARRLLEAEESLPLDENPVRREEVEASFTGASGRARSGALTKAAPDNSGDEEN